MYINKNNKDSHNVNSRGIEAWQDLLKTGISVVGQGPFWVCLDVYWYLRYAVHIETRRIGETCSSDVLQLGETVVPPPQR